MKKNHKEYCRKNRSCVSWIQGALFGGVSALIATLLLAPRSGKKTRQKVNGFYHSTSKKSKEFLNYSQEHAKSFLQHTNELAKNVSQEIKDFAQTVLSEEDN